MCICCNSWLQDLNERLAGCGGWRVDTELITLSTRSLSGHFTQREKNSSNGRQDSIREDLLVNYRPEDEVLCEDASYNEAHVTASHFLFKLFSFLRKKSCCIKNDYCLFINRVADILVDVLT